MNGACPPSSREILFKVSEQLRISILPTEVEPEKLTFRTSKLPVQDDLGEPGKEVAHLALGEPEK